MKRLLAGVAVLLLPSAGAAQLLAIEGATVIPMDRDTALVDHTVIVRGDRLSWVGPSRLARVPANARRLDGRNAYVLPGLADMHVHLRCADDLPRFIAAGVTTVQNMNGRPAHLELRAKVRTGALIGPRIYTTGPSIFYRFLGGSGDFVRLRTTADAERVAREQKRAGLPRPLRKPLTDPSQECT